MTSQPFNKNKMFCWVIKERCLLKTRPCMSLHRYFNNSRSLCMRMCSWLVSATVHLIHLLFGGRIAGLPNTCSIKCNEIIWMGVPREDKVTALTNCEESGNICKW